MGFSSRSTDNFRKSDDQTDLQIEASSLTKARQQDSAKEVGLRPPSSPPIAERPLSRPWCRANGTVLLLPAVRTAAHAHWGRSRTTSAGLFSSWSPRKRGWRSRASSPWTVGPALRGRPGSSIESDPVAFSQFRWVELSTSSATYRPVSPTRWTKGWTIPE